jgi:CubicO group peptidase (beta-lactamase class C family)
LSPTRFGPSAPPSDLIPLPEQPDGVAWPTRDWPEGSPHASADAARIRTTYDRLFAAGAKPQFGLTYALLVVQGGRVVAEQYGPEQNRDTTLPSWSMAKSILHALIGIAVGEGKLSTRQYAPVPAWQAEGDARAEITIDQLLRMSSGLRFLEEYETPEESDTLRMLFGVGKDDVSGYAEDMPLEGPPDSIWSYSSGTSNILSAILQRTLGLRGDDHHEFMRQALFDRIGMGTSKPLFDASGTWIASSFNFATAQDFARFGLLYLRDGIWEGERILPEGWVDYARTPTAHSEEQYGGHFWLAQNGTGLFSCNGFQSQYIVMDPARDLVVVRLGRSHPDQKGPLLLALRDLVESFPRIG